MRQKTKNKTPFWIGIDPGMKGGIAVLDDALRVCEAVPMPVRGKELDYRGLQDLVLLYRTTGFFFIENVHAFPGSAAAATFNFGRAVEGVKATLEVLGCRYAMLKPSEWQKVAWLGVPRVKKPNKRTDTKATSLTALARLFPDVSPEVLCPGSKRKPHDGIIDAILIAYAGKIIIGGE